MQGVRLANAFMQSADLHSAHFEGADLHGAYLEGANIAAAHFDSANLQGAHLEDVKCYPESWFGIPPIPRYFRAHLAKAILRSAHLERAQLWDADLRGADFLDAHMENARLDNAKLDGAYFYNSDLTNVYIQTCTLHKTQLRHAHGIASTNQLSGAWGMDNPELLPLSLTEAERKTLVEESLAREAEWNKGRQSSKGETVEKPRNANPRRQNKRADRLESH